MDADQTLDRWQRKRKLEAELRSQGIEVVFDEYAPPHILMTKSADGRKLVVCNLDLGTVVEFPLRPEISFQPQFRPAGTAYELRCRELGSLTYQVPKTSL